FVECGVHGRDHRRVLPHAEIVVGTPHSDVAGAPAGMARGARKTSALPLQFGEYPVTPLLMEGVQLRGEKGFEGHTSLVLCQIQSVSNIRIGKIFPSRKTKGRFRVRPLAPRTRWLRTKAI